MSSGPTDSASQPHRSDDQWLAELSGKMGPRAQRIAHEALSRYLMSVVLTYLAKRSVSGHVLATFAQNELAELAKDFVQDTLEKLAQDNFALLHKFEGRGSFTSWIAQVANRITASEVRRPYWMRRNRSGNSNVDSDEQEGSGGPINADERSDNDPEAMLEQQELGEAIQGCRAELTERYRTIFDRFIVLEESAEEVATALGISPNAVYMLVYRVKRKMQACLSKKGMDPFSTGL